MRFAVVEYNSKSGDIWRHADKHPNYLANPLTEIDPTSFGCYVSALKGEHVPLTKLATAGPAPLTLLRKVFKRLTGKWPLYSLQYLSRFDVILMVHQLSDAHELVAATRRLKNKLPQLIIIGVPTQPYGPLREAVDDNHSVRQQLIDFIDACDIFVSVVRNTVGWYEDLAQTPVKYLPQPYPSAFAGQNFLPRNQKDPIILVAGVTQRDDIKKGQLVAKALQKKFPHYQIQIPKVPDLSYNARNLHGTQYKEQPFEQWREHLKTLARATLVINTDYTQTRGRVQTDCAAVGTVSLGANSDGQRDLYPSLMGSPSDTVEQLVAQASQLLTNPDHYQQTADTACERLAKYDYSESADRLRLLVKTFRQSSGKTSP